MELGVDDRTVRRWNQLLKKQHSDSSRKVYVRPVGRPTVLPVALERKLASMVMQYVDSGAACSRETLISLAHDLAVFK